MAAKRVTWTTEAEQSKKDLVEMYALILNAEAERTTRVRGANHVSSHFVAAAAEKLERPAKKTVGADALLALGPTILSLPAGAYVALLADPPADAVHRWVSLLMVGLFSLGLALTFVAVTLKVVKP